MPKRFLITGGAGFIGSAVVRHLINNSLHEVLVIDALTYAGNLANLALVARSNRFSFLHADIRVAADMAAAIAEFEPDVIMHLAAESHVDRSIDTPMEFVSTNLLGTAVMLEVAFQYYRKLSSARRARFRFHHISTDEVFGSLGNEGYFTEDTPYDPRSPYSASKAGSDHLVRAWYHTFGLPIVLTNCSNNYGPFHFPEKLIPLVIINAINGEPLPIYGTGENIRDWLYVEDHARALILAADQGGVGETYAIGGYNECKNIEIVKMICGILDRLRPDRSGPYERLIAFVADRPGHDARYAIDSSKISSALGWQPRESLETGLERTVRWYLDNRAWWQSIRNGAYRSERLGLDSNRTVV